MVTEWFIDKGQYLRMGDYLDYARVYANFYLRWQNLFSEFHRVKSYYLD